MTEKNRDDILIMDFKSHQSKTNRQSRAKKWKTIKIQTTTLYNVQHRKL